MSINFNKKSQAFTLVELLIVLIIIGVLAGGLWLAFGGSDAKAQETACLGNRETIKTAWSMHNFAASSNEDLQSFIAAKYHDQISNNNAACPSGGSYSDKNGDGIVECSCPEHSAKMIAAGSSTSPSSHTYTNTDLALLNDGKNKATDNDKASLLSQLATDTNSVILKVLAEVGTKPEGNKIYAGDISAKLVEALEPVSLGKLMQYTDKDGKICTRDYKVTLTQDANKNYQLSSLLIKVGAYAFVSYRQDDGSYNSYKITNGLYAGNTETIAKNESWLRNETNKDYEGIEQGKNADGSESKGWTFLQ